MFMSLSVHLFLFYVQSSIAFWSAKDKARVELVKRGSRKCFQALYGKKTSYGPRHGTTSRPLPPAEEDPELCKDPKVDAMFNTKDGDTIVFKGACTNYNLPICILSQARNNV